jgi:hypothetical protein
VSALRDRSESFLIVPWNVDEAAELAHDLLGDSERFRHSQGVAQRARELSVHRPLGAGRAARRSRLAA